MARAWASDRRPWRMASSVAGSWDSRLAVDTVEVAAPTGTPSISATREAVVRCPVSEQAPEVSIWAVRDSLTEVPSRRTSVTEVNRDTAAEPSSWLTSRAEAAANQWRADSSMGAIGSVPVAEVPVSLVITLDASMKSVFHEGVSNPAEALIPPDHGLDLDELGGGRASPSATVTSNCAGRTLLAG